MPQFRYRILADNGRTRKGVVEARTRAEATETLVARGETPIRVELQRPWLIGLEKAPISKSDLATFLNDLAALHDAGVPLRRALELLSRSEGKSAVRETASLMMERLDSGADMSGAARIDGSDDLLLASELAKAGEIAGRLSETLRAGASILERQSLFAASLRRAMAYPAFLLVLAVVAIVALALFAGPSLAPLLEEANATSGGLALLIGTGEFLRQFGFGLLAILGFLAALLNHFGRRQPIRRWLAQARMLMPGIGSITRDVNCGAFARTFGALLAGGTPAARAIELAAASAPNSAWRAKLANAGNALREGRSVSGAIATIENAPIELLHLAQVGEEAGALGEMAARSGEILVERALRRLDALAATAGPVLLVVMGVLIAAMMSAFLTGLSSLGDVAL